VDDFHPQPDVVVCSAEAEYIYYVERYWLVAEVISPSNSVEMIERKMELYRSHPDNLYALTVDQDAVSVNLFARASGWESTILQSLDDVLSLPEFDFSMSIRDLYKGTPLTR
jgi:Uma2 family endonuclease